MGFNRFSLAFVVMIMIMLLKPNGGRAAVLVKSNTTYECNSLLNGCRIGDDLETELEFFMGSDVIRILQDGSNKHPTGGTKNPKKAAIKCPKAPYDHCLPKGNEKTDCKGVYKRGCRPPK